MAKINNITGHQRLLQLARSQLGSSANINVVDDVDTPSIRQGHFGDKHENLSARSGAVASTSLTLAQRAERRLQMQRERQQYNLESIMKLALEYCPEQVSAQDVDPDWFQQYCELVLEISNNSMQQLWAKILAGEIASPGKFSLKTLHSLKRMSFKEAQALQQAAALSCRARQDLSARIYFGYFCRPSIWRWLTGRSRALLNLSQYGLSYPQILSLIEIGILHSAEIESGELPSGQTILWQFQQISLKGVISRSGVVLQYYKYTATGAELLPLLNCAPNPQYLQSLKHLLTNIVQFQD